MNRCKRCISILLISAMLLGLFSTSALAATTSGELKSFDEQSSTFFTGETKNFSFTPTDDSGLYIFQLSGPSYYDHDQEFFHVTCGGKAINSVYEGGGSTNCYVVPLTQEQDYMVSFTNPVDSQATFQISATRLQYLTDVMTLPGSTTLTAAEDGSLSGYLSAKVTQDGWYSFLSEKNHDGWLEVYSVDLRPVGACGWSDMLPASIYLKQGDYILRIYDYNCEGGEESSVVFQGKTSSFSSISTEVSALVYPIGSSGSPGIDCVTFTPLETGIYTFHIEFPAVEGPWVERLTLYYSDMSHVANCTTSYDEKFELYGDLTAVLTVGNTYYLEIVGSSAAADSFGYCAGTASVSKSGSSPTGSITSLYPANGSIFDFANTSVDTRPRIFFDREVAGISGRAKLDFSKGTLEIRKAFDDELVYSVKESSATSGISTNVALWNVDGKPTAIRLHDVTTILDYSTEYYVTMPAGFVKFADGTSSPAIEKGDWSFKSAPSPFSYAVTYLLNGGSGTVPTECWSVGEKVTIIQDIPEKAGFIFNGWSDGSTTYQPGESFTMPDHDVLLTAIWIKRCTVTYDLNGGTGIASSKSYLAGETVTIISDEPTKEGYAFDGWTDGSTTYQSGATFTMPDHDVTLKAVWKAIYGPPTPTFTVTYLLDGGEGEIPVQQYPLNGVVVVTSQKPTKEGAVFVGWTDGNKTYQPGESFKMPNHDVTLTALWTEDPAQWPINQGEVFLKQEQRRTCTLASATMMLRRRAILDNNDCWRSITETAVRKVAWRSGLKYKFDYLGMYVKTLGLCSNGYCTEEEKTNYFISSLKNHPEGIVIYNHGKPHAVLLTDYDERTHTFYCADPASGAKSGRIPLSECTIPGKTQGEKINAIAQVWFIEENKNQKKLESTEIESHCPVEMRVTIADTVLNSIDVHGTISNDYAIMTAQGSGQERNVSVRIIGDHTFERDISVELFGTGTGKMTFVVTHLYDDATKETHTFRNVPVTEASIGIAEGFYPQSTVLLTLINTTGTTECWATNPNEETSKPSQDFDMVPDETTNIPTSGNAGSNSSSTDYNIIASSMTGGTVAITPKSASKGNTVTITVKPNADYVLDDLIVTDKSGNKLKLTQKSDNKYTFIMPASKVTVSATFSEMEQEAQRWINPYTDVFEDAYYYDAVQWAVKNGITTGTSSTTFGPGIACTRAQAVTFLWRAAGSPAPMNTEMPFADVATDAYYHSAVLWAVEQGITTGTSATTFEPDAKCSRAQIVTFLWRSKKSPVSGTVNCFPDVVADAYCYNAVQWATKNGITSGTSATTFSPNNDCTRAQIITFLYRSTNS